MKMKKIEIPAIDLFSGCGGVTSGLNKSGFKVKVAVEIDKEAVSTYCRNFPDTKVIEEDIRNVKGEEILKLADLKMGDLFLVAGCPPCQNFSIQNRNRDINNTERKELPFEFARLVIEMHPALILMENVPGIAAGNNQTVFNKLMKELENEYVIIKGILNAADYGVPQKRKRFVLHGIRKDLVPVLTNFETSFTLPKKSYTDPKNKIDGKDLELREWRTVRQAISDLPSIKAGEKYKRDSIFNHACMNLAEINIKRIQYIRKHGGSRTCLPPKLSLQCHKKYSGHKDVYGIMDWDKPAPTITGGCLAYSKGRFGHPSQDRAISVREAARLQTFDDTFIFSDNLSKAALQIGNAVPVDLVKASGNKLYEILMSIKEVLVKTG